MYRDGLGGGPTPLFFSMPCRDNIESLLHQHIGPFTGAVQVTTPPPPPPSLSSLTARSPAFFPDPDVDDVIKAQFCAAAAAAAAAAAGQSRGKTFQLFLICAVIYPLLISLYSVALYLLAEIHV